jgi:PAS domain S-box-containing protein
MKIEYKILIFSILLILFFWVINGILDAFVNHGGRFSHLFPFHGKGLYQEVIFSICFLIYGIIMSIYITSKNRFEKELMETKTTIKSVKTRTEAIISAIGDGISIQDNDFKVLYQNEAHKKIIGDHIGEYCYKAYERSDKKCRGCPVDLSFKDGRVHTAERTGHTDSGTVDVQITSSPLKDSKGKIIAGIEIVRDITRRKEAEKSLYESEEKYRKLFETSGEAIVLHDLSGKILDANDRAIRLFGYSSESELVFLNISDLHPRKDIEISMKALEKISENHFANFRIDFKKKSGKIFSAEVSSSLFQIKDEEVIQSIVRDVTDRNLIKETLEESMQLFHALFNQASDCIFLMDSLRKDGPVILEANKSACERHGYSRNELIGKPVSMLNDAETRKHIPQRTERLMAGEKLTFEGVHVHKNGSTFPVEISAQNILIEGKLYTLAIDRDITERKRIEKESYTRLRELEEFYSMSVNREIKMKELKAEIENLKSKLVQKKTS